jgi:UPF0271 protein
MTRTLRLRSRRGDRNRCDAPAGGYGDPVQVDLNADLGEGFGVWRLGDDEGLLELITSANVACGFHAGDPVTMRRVCAAAVRGRVAIGAQVGYRDLVGFGRRRFDIDAAELTADVLYQIGALDGVARADGGRVQYVKPHGALYNTAADDPEQAAAIVAAIAEFNAELPLLGLPGSCLAAAADERGLPFVAEAFADRGYRADGRLVPRSRPGALLTDADAVAERAVRLVTERRVVADDGTSVAVEAASICLHGDTPGAVELAGRVRAALCAAGARLAPFAP